MQVTFLLLKRGNKDLDECDTLLRVLRAVHEEFVVAVAGAPGRAEPLVAVGYTASPSRSGLVKSVMVLAETWMGSEAPAFPKRLRVPRGAEVESTLPWLRTDRDSWSWRRA